MKTIDELNKLNTKNLLRYYRAERQRYYCSISSFHFGFDAVDYMWDHFDGYEKEKIKYNNWNEYLILIKDILNKRENVINYGKIFRRRDSKYKRYTI